MSSATSWVKPHWYNLLCRSDERIGISDKIGVLASSGTTSNVPFDVAVAKEKHQFRQRGLLDDYPSDTLTNHLLVNVVTLDKKRYFAIFPSHLEFAKYQAKLDIDKKCFFETILGDRSQKPHFDIDIDVGKYPDVIGDDVMNNLVDAIFEILSESDVEIKIESDLLVFTSHGPTRQSYHIVIDHYMHLNNLEAKAFYHKVLEKMDPELSDFVDPAVYLSKQQFRIVGSQKPRSGRIKTLSEKWTYHDEEIVYQYVREPRDDLHKMLLQLEASLVSHTSNCLPLPNFIQVDDNGRVLGKSSDSYFEENLSRDIAMKALKLLAETAGLSINDKRFPYRFIGVSGGIISLLRVHPSRCRICNRIHENENPYLFIIGAEYTVFFNCRRNRKNFLVGKLGPSQDNEEVDEDEDKDESNTSLSKKSPTNDITPPNISVSGNTIEVVSTLASSKSSGLKSVAPRDRTNKDISDEHLARILKKMEDAMPWP